MTGTGGGPPRAPPSPAKAAVIDLFKNSHAFNGVSQGVESTVFASSLVPEEDENLAADALLVMGSGSIYSTEQSTQSTQYSTQSTGALDDGGAGDDASSAEKGPPAKKRKSDSTTKEGLVDLQRQVLVKELDTLQKFDSVLGQAEEFLRMAMFHVVSAGAPGIPSASSVKRPSV